MTIPEEDIHCDHCGDYCPCAPCREENADLWEWILESNDAVWEDIEADESD